MGRAPPPPPGSTGCSWNIASSALSLPRTPAARTFCANSALTCSHTSPTSAAATPSACCFSCAPNRRFFSTLPTSMVSSAGRVAFSSMPVRNDRKYVPPADPCTVDSALSVTLSSCRYRAPSAPFSDDDDAFTASIFGFRIEYRSCVSSGSEWFSTVNYLKY